MEYNYRKFHQSTLVTLLSLWLYKNMNFAYYFIALTECHYYVTYKYISRIVILFFSFQGHALLNLVDSSDIKIAIMALQA